MDDGGMFVGFEITNTFLAKLIFFYMIVTVDTVDRIIYSPNLNLK